MPDKTDAQTTGYLLEARGISLRADDHQILDQVDLRIEHGQVVTVVGPNGSGKSTLVRAVLGLIRRDSGTVTMAPGLRIGYVPQHFHIDDSLPISVDRFLRLAAPGPRDKRVHVLAEVGASRIADTPLQKISGGEMRRVLLACALLRDPGLLVLDEPSAGVDISGQAELYGLIRELRDRRGCGVLLVSHDLHLVMAATDQVVCLNHHVCCSGRPDAVSAHPEYISLFGREVSRSYAVYTHHHDHDHDLSGEAVEKEEGARG